jgi:hypothetical protein
VGIGARVVQMLNEPKTVSRLWSEFKRDWNGELKITYDWFVLALDLLYTLRAVEIEHGRLRRDISVERQDDTRDSSEEISS